MDYNMENLTLRIMDITYSSAVDGIGFRDTLFVNYCPHHCPGCHNPQTWDKANGKDVPMQEVYDKLMKSYITNVTFSGGEPFCQARELAVLAQNIRNGGKTIWVYSGFLFEDIMADADKKALLEQCEVLVDGRFEEDKKKNNLRFKGSTNQRIIDVAKSIEAGEVVLWHDAVEEYLK